MVLALACGVVLYKAAAARERLVLVALGITAMSTRLFPFRHEYRLGPAGLIIRGNHWYNPAWAVARLRETLQYDPHSAYLKDWIRTFE